MFEKLTDFWDVVIFAFVVLMLASLQLRFATYPEGVLALIAIVCAIGLIRVQYWAVIGLDLVFLSALLVYFGQIWMQSILHASGRYVCYNLLKMVTVFVLLLYLGRERMEQRLA